MTPEIVFIRLLVSHLLADFVFQSHRMVEQKNERLFSKSSMLHILIVLLSLSLLLWGIPDTWFAIMWLTFAHAAIDCWKITNLKKTRAEIAGRELTEEESHALWLAQERKFFLLDQVFHLLSLLIAWIYLCNLWPSVWAFWPSLVTDRTFLYWLLGYMVVTLPTGILIGMLTSQWRTKLDDGENEPNSMINVGKWIGYCERILAFTFIMIGEARALGFLIAAKSIFRFGDLKDTDDRKRTEYIFVGSMLSFTIAIIVGLVIRGQLG
jgi:hypothetical protein